MVYATDLLGRLLWMNLLSERLAWIGIKDAINVRLLIDLEHSGFSSMDSAPPMQVLEKLREFEFIQIDKSHSLKPGKAVQRRKMSLHFLEAVNFELTYACNMNCSHCLQQGFRPKANKMRKQNAFGYGALIQGVL